MSTSRKRSRSPDRRLGRWLAVLAWASAAAARADDAGDLARLRAEMDAIVAGHTHCHNVVQCRVVSMGYDACGHPTLHVPYNNITDIKGALETKAAEYTFIEEERMRGRPRASDCRETVTPRPVCHRNQCRAGGLND